VRLLKRYLQRLLVFGLGVATVWLIVFVVFRFADHRLPWVLALGATYGLACRSHGPQDPTTRTCTSFHDDRRRYARGFAPVTSVLGMWCAASNDQGLLLHNPPMSVVSGHSPLQLMNVRYREVGTLSRTSWMGAIQPMLAANTEVAKGCGLRLGRSKRPRWHESGCQRRTCRASTVVIRARLLTIQKTRASSFESIETDLVSLARSGNWPLLQRFSMRMSLDRAGDCGVV
jgi:hypothetical protein